MTSELIAQIKAAVGEDVDPEGFAVFECGAVNSLPLTGKDGTIFEKAQISLLTLKQMADSINGGNTLPLIHDHDVHSIPMGRVFHSDTILNQTNSSVELRTLFYVDETEQKIAAKLDAGSIDEVSVQFLASQILCSECDFDFRGEDATWRNFADRTCANGHTVGTDGVHIRLVGLQTFTELSLVTRGAAKNAKIVGKSASKLAAPLQALAARGYEVDELFLTASLGEYEVDVSVILAQLTEQTTTAATATAQLTAMTAERDTANTALAAAQAEIVELKAAAATNADGGTTVVELTAERDEAKAVLTDIYTRLATAAGSSEAAPETIADLKAGIEAHQSKLTAIIPIGGAGADTRSNEPEVGSKFDASRAAAFSLNR
jgi:hypothetical protein